MDHEQTMGVSSTVLNQKQHMVYVQRQNVENISSTTQWYSVTIIIITSHLCIRTIAIYLYKRHVLAYEINAVLSLIINSSRRSQWLSTIFNHTPTTLWSIIKMCPSIFNRNWRIWKKFVSYYSQINVMCIYRKTAHMTSNASAHYFRKHGKTHSDSYKCHKNEALMMQ